MTSFFSAEGGPIWIKFRRLVQNDMSTAVMWSKSKPIWRTFGQILWHVIPEPPATLKCAATWRIQCHDPRASCHSHCRVLPPDEFNGMSFQSHVLYCRVLPLDALTVMIQSHMPHCRVQSPGEINVMIVPHCRV